MDGVRTRGHAAALDAVAAMIRGSAPGALLLVGPSGVGKSTLATDLAAGLLCTAADPAARPCGGCRACRLVASDGHPDLHRLEPGGAGRQIVIGGPGAKVPGVRDLLSDLALLPVEGGARVAIVAGAQRLNEDAQNALLKALEEPGPGVTIVLCADAEEPLLPTIRSRCARLRLGPISVRDVETILAELGVADPPLAARLARISAGRPGVALAWAREPEALRARDELGRTLLDLTDARPADRLAAVRAAATRASTLTAVASEVPDATPTGAAPPKAAPPVEAELDPDAEPEDAVPVRSPATERRRAAAALIEIWTDVARDVALCQRGLDRSVRDLGWLDDSRSVAARLDRDAVTAFLDRLGRAGVLIAGNVSPELVLDDLALAWPRAARVAA